METEEWGILDSIPDYSNYKSFTERYFTKRYITNVNGIKNNDIMIMFHSNRIALLCLAPSHHFFQKKDEYIVNFKVGNVDRRDNAVKGKGKKGGQKLNPKSVVCKVEYKDGTSFDVPSCMKGKLIEVNEELVTSPELLREMPDADGFIAVILSSIEVSDTTKKELLAEEDYLRSINEDTSGGNGDVGPKQELAEDNSSSSSKETSGGNDVALKKKLLPEEHYSSSINKDMIGGNGDVAAKKELLPEDHLSSINKDTSDGKALE